MLKGLAGVVDNYYDVPKYHFNSKAANAFAARFYLYKRDYEKVIQYADAVLGQGVATAPTMMRDYWATNYSNVDANIQAFISAESQSNLMLVATNSGFWRTIGIGTRYGVNRDAARATIYGSGPSWPGVCPHPCFMGKLYINGEQEYGLYYMKLGELFEYTDKVAGIGYVHLVRTEFTAEETLLCRAEAKIYTGDLQGAYEDLNVWEASHRNIPGTTDGLEDFTRAVIEDYYNPASQPLWEYDPRPYIFNDLHIDDICDSKYQLTADKLPYIYCVLHFRRIETLFDGYRWFDIKRYGIEVTHKIGRTRVETLTINDPRRALQIPSEVISAGMQGNNRFPLVDGGSTGKYIPYTGSYHFNK